MVLPFALLAAALTGCTLNDPTDRTSQKPRAAAPRGGTAAALSTYFPPPETRGGWRKARTSSDVAAVGMDLTKLNALGAYTMGLPWQNYSTGVSGFDPRNKATLVIKNGWLVGEYYNREAARTAVYYLASNGKTFAMMLLGRLQLDYPALAIAPGSRLYDQRWLPEGFPLSDARKANITLDHVFRHASGIIPQDETAIADGAVRTEAGWDFAPFTVGKDPDWRASGPLYFPPGSPSRYTKGSTYSSVAYNHFSLLFRRVTKLEPGAYLRSGILNPIGVGRMDYKRTRGMADYQWATAGNGLAGARDFGRLAYLLLHEGNWAGRRIFASSWIRTFTTVPAYPNIRSNHDCYWGTAYPKDLYSTVGSGMNRAIVVPSLDLVATINGRLPNNRQEEVMRNFLQKLFAAVTQRYVTCGGRTVNG
ncbi:MAG: serine hydrolase [Gemmatimonadales bacterium]|nr:serine hydrolase [Gemmatimonadales bacterium]